MCIAGNARTHYPAQRATGTLRTGCVKVIVCRQQDQFVTNTELRQQSVDRSDLHTAASTLDAQIGRRDVVVAIRHDKGQGTKPGDDLLVSFGSRESLQQFL
jgi:hypothetical protein